MSSDKTVSYWFFIYDDNCFKWAVIDAPDMPLEEAKSHIKTIIGKPILDIGYGKEVPTAFNEMPNYSVSI